MIVMERQKRLAAEGEVAEMRVKLSEFLGRTDAWEEQWAALTAELENLHAMSEENQRLRAEIDRLLSQIVELQAGQRITDDLRATYKEYRGVR